MLAATLVPTTAAGHRFWEEQDPAERAQQRIHFFKNVSMLGGLIIAAGDTEGQPGVVWRTRRVAKDARREARHLAARGPARGGAGQGQGHLSCADVERPGPPRGRPDRSTPSSRCPAASR